MQLLVDRADLDKVGDAGAYGLHRGRLRQSFEQVQAGTFGGGDAARRIVVGGEQVVKGLAQLGRQHLLNSLDQLALAPCHGGGDQSGQTVLARELDVPLRQQIEAAEEDQLRSQMGRGHRFDVHEQLGIASTIESPHAVCLEDRKFMALPGAGRIAIRLEQLRCKAKQTSGMDDVALAVVAGREEPSGTGEVGGVDQ